MKKELNINTSLCDMRKISEKALEKYDSLSVNAAVILTSDEAAELLAKAKVNLNSAAVFKVSGECTVKNGSYTISAAGNKRKNGFLMVNGTLLVEKGSEEALESYEKIIVNGELVSPVSMSGAVAYIQCNGSVLYYPDNAILFDEEIDRLFVLRAKENDYYFSHKNVFFTESGVNYAELAKKRVTIEAAKAFVLESQLENLLPVITRKTAITVIPDGCVILKNDIVINNDTIRSYGNKLYVFGTVTVTDEKALNELEYLGTSETVYCKLGCEQKLRELKCQDIVSFKGKLVKDLSEFTLTKSFFLECGELTITDCAAVKISSDIEAELIRSSLRISDAAIVSCSKKQDAAVREISDDIAIIKCDENNDDGENDGADGIETINTACYEF